MNHAKDEKAADHRITQQLSLEGTSENHSVLSSTQSRISKPGPAKPGCPGPQTPPMVVTPSHPWTTCSGAWLPSQCNQKRVFFTASVWSPTSCPVTDYPWEESVCLLHIKSSKPSLPYAVQSQLAQPLLINTWWLWWPLAGVPAEHPCLKLRSPEVDRALQRRPWPAGKALLTQPPRLAHGRCGAHQEPLNLLHKVASQLLSPAACAGAWGEVQGKDQDPPSLCNTPAQSCSGRTPLCKGPGNSQLQEHIYTDVQTHTFIWCSYMCTHTQVRCKYTLIQKHKKIFEGCKYFSSLAIEKVQSVSRPKPTELVLFQNITVRL